MDHHEWRDLMHRFEQHLRVERGLADLTVRNYRTDLEPLFDFMRKNDVPNLKALDRAALRAYLAWLLELGYVRRSVARKVSALRTLLRWLVRLNLIDADPLPRRGVMKLDSRLPRFLSQNEAAKLVHAADPGAEPEKKSRGKSQGPRPPRAHLRRRTPRQRGPRPGRGRSQPRRPRAACCGQRLQAARRPHRRPRA